MIFCRFPHTCGYLFRMAEAVKDADLYISSALEILIEQFECIQLNPLRCLRCFRKLLLALSEAVDST